MQQGAQLAIDITLRNAPSANGLPQRNAEVCGAGDRCFLDWMEDDGVAKPCHQEGKFGGGSRCGVASNSVC